MEPLSPLANPTATRSVLDSFGLSAKYSYGQNFLVNDAIIRKIIDAADLSTDDSVLEVGPGIGTLTIALLKSAGHVSSVERDADLPAVLAQTCAPWADRFTLIEGDATGLTQAHLKDAAPAAPLPNKLVANLPYEVASAIVLTYFQRFPFIEQATVMVQREVADRMAARLGTKDYGAYTVKLSLFAQPVGRFPVGPTNFYPQPRVESTVITLERIPDPLLTPDLLEATCTMADAAFTNRRKTISNSCKAYFQSRKLPVDSLSGIFETAGIDPRRRGETLDKAEFLKLGNALLETAL